MLLRILGRANGFVFWLLKKIPIVSTIVKIVNSYVYEGDGRALDRLAPPWLWMKAIVLPLLVAGLITAALLRDAYSFPSFTSYQLDVNGNLADVLVCFTPRFENVAAPFDAPGSLVLSVFPNLLGFGIGVYALIFALSPRSLQFLQEYFGDRMEAGARKHGSALVLNASMAYPLVVIATSIVPAVFQQLNSKSQGLLVLTWLVFWYGFVVLVELLGVLFSLGEHDTMDKLTPDES